MKKEETLQPLLPSTEPGTQHSPKLVQSRSDSGAPPTPGSSGESNGGRRSAGVASTLLHSLNLPCLVPGETLVYELTD